MTAKNDITNDAIKSKHTNDAFRNSPFWDTRKVQREEIKVDLSEAKVDLSEKKIPSLLRDQAC